MKQGFTLIELLVVISIIGVLIGILLPAISRAREQARIIAVNAELCQISIALEMYCEDHKKYPPTQADCATGRLTDHLYQLPKVLVTGHYLPSMPREETMSSKIEDRYNRGHTYKYRSVGEIIVDRDIIDEYIWAKMWIPDNFPTSSSIEPNEQCWHPDKDERSRFSESHGSYAQVSPVSWVVFSLGPWFSQEWLEEKLGADNFNRFPVPRELWYTPKERKGFVVRMRLKNGTQVGSFEGKP
jgi:prepilin-type N-terminal cleavage/methylation domain-containing protein